MADIYLHDLDVAESIQLTDLIPFSSDPGGTPASKNITLEDFVAAVVAAPGFGSYLPLAGGTMTGALTLHSSSLLKWGTTASFPALKRSSTELQVRLADDSGYAPFRSGPIVINDTADGSGNYQGLKWNVGPFDPYFRISILGGGSVFRMGVYADTDLNFVANSSVGLVVQGSQGGIVIGSNNDVRIARIAADTLGLQRGTNAQTLQVYGTYTDGSNFVRASLAATSTAVTMAAETAGTGADNIDVNITPAGTGSVNLGSKAKIGTATLSHDGLATLSIDSVIAQNATHFSFYGNRAGAGTWAGMDGFAVRDASFYAFANSGQWYGTIDLALARNAAGIAEINNGTPGTYRDLKLRTLYGEGGTLTGNLTISGASLFVGGSYAIAIGDAGNGYYGGWMANTYLALSPNTVFGWNSGDGTTVKDVLLRRDAANTLALRNGSNGQKLRVYGDYTGASQYCALELSCTQTGGDYFSHYIGPVNAGGSDYWSDNRGTIGGWAFLTIAANSNPSSPDGFGSVIFQAAAITAGAVNEGGYNFFFDGRGSAWTGLYGHKNFFSNSNTASHTLGLWQVSGHTKSALTVYTNSVLKADITSAGAFRSYGAWTDDSNYVRASLSAAASSVTLAAQTAGTGADDVDVSINPAGAGRVYFLSNGLQLDSYGTGVRLFGVSYIQNNSAPIRILCGSSDGIAVLDTGGVTIDNPVSPDTVATLKLNARGTQLAPLLNAGGFTVNGTGTFVTFGHQNSASYPALKRSSTELQVRLADDSGYAPFRTATLNIHGELQFPASTWIIRAGGAGYLIGYENDMLLYGGRFFSLGSTGANYADCSIGREAAGVLAQRNDHTGAALVSQTFRIYGARTDDSNYVRASLAATSTSVTLAAQTAGTGADNVDVNITPAGTGKVVTPAIVSANSYEFSSGASITSASLQTLVFVGEYGGMRMEIGQDVLARKFLCSGEFAIGWGAGYGTGNLLSIGAAFYKDTDNVIAQRNSTNAQTMRVYGTYTDGSNYVRASLAATSTSVTLAAETAGTGADDVSISINPAGTGVVGIGGLTSSYPALKRSSTELRVRLADDSGYATTAAGCFTSHGSIVDPSSGGYWMLRHRNSDGGAYWGFSQKSGGTGDIQVWIEGYARATLGSHIVVANTNGGFSWSTGPGSAGNNLSIIRDTTDVVAIYGTTNAALRLYGTYTDASNYVRASLAATSTSVTLAAETAGTGADNIDTNLRAAGTGAVTVGNGSNQFSFYIHDGNSNCIAIREGGGWSYIGTVIDRNLVLMRDSVRAATLTANGFMLGNASDAGISRNADGVVEVNNGTPGTYRDMRLRTITVDAADGNGLQFNGGGSVEAYSNYLTLTSPYTGFVFYSPQVGGNVLFTDNTTLNIALHTQIASNKAIYFTSGGEISAASNVLNIKAYTSFVLSTTGGSTRRVAEISNTGELYGFYSYTDGSNYQGYKLTSGATSVTLSAETAGTGADNIALTFTQAGTGGFVFTGHGSIGVGTSHNMSLGLESNASITSGTYNASFGYRAGKDCTTGYSNTAIGNNALEKNITGSESVAVGQGAGYSNTAATSTSVAIGVSALFAGCSSCVGVGYQALYSNGAVGLTAIGFQALKNHTGGGGETAIGYCASFSNTTGYDNTAVGNQALRLNQTGINNTAIGSASLYNTTGSNNTAVGLLSGYDITTGNRNVILGGQAGTGTGITTGSDNILIGYDVRYGLTSTVSGQLNIGNLIFASGLTTGNTLSAGYVGIGTTVPTAYLDLPASTTSAASLRIRTGTAPTSPNSGDVWHDSNQKTLSYYAAGVTQTVNGVLFTQTQTVTVANTVTETALTGTGTGTLTLPANFFAAGKTIKIRALGYHSSTASPNITIRVKLGSTTILTTGAIASGNGSDDTWVCDAVFTCRTTGGTGTVIGQGYYEEVHGNGNRGGMVNTATTTIDTTASQAISITVEWGTADAGNTISCTNVLIEVLN